MIYFSSSQNLTLKENLPAQDGNYLTSWLKDHTVWEKAAQFDISVYDRIHPMLTESMSLSWKTIHLWLKNISLYDTKHPSLSWKRSLSPNEKQSSWWWKDSSL